MNEERWEQQAAADTAAVRRGMRPLEQVLADLQTALWAEAGAATQASVQAGLDEEFRAGLAELAQELQDAEALDMLRTPQTPAVSPEGHVSLEPPLLGRVRGRELTIDDGARLMRLQQIEMLCQAPTGTRVWPWARRGSWPERVFDLD